jgi:hypothetical protein
MENTQTVQQSRVGSARINEVRKSQLFHSPESLKGPGLNNAPKYPLQMIIIDIELDEIV